MVLGLGLYGIWLGLLIALGSTATLLWRCFEARLRLAEQQGAGTGY